MKPLMYGIISPVPGSPARRSLRRPRRSMRETRERIGAAVLINAHVPEAKLLTNVPAKPMEQKMDGYRFSSDQQFA